MSTVYYDNINGFSQLKMENGKLYGRLNSGEWQEIETGGEQGEPGAPGADGVSAYVYWAWCADPATGAGFSLTDPADYISFITRNTVLVSPQFSDFSTWVKYVGSDGKNGADGVSTYVYYAYATDEDGTNFSLSPADGLNFQAILVTHTEIASPSLSDFAGMFYQYKDALASIITAGNAGPTGNTSPGYGGTFTVPYFTFDAYGRITGTANRTITMPAKGGGATAYITAASVTATRGYIKFSNKLLIQWGYETVSGSVAQKTLTFPTAFANTTYTFVRTSGNVTNQDASQIRAYTGDAGTRATSSIKLYAGGNASNYSWIAIGTCS